LYNNFTRLKAKGFIVLDQGKRFFLKPKDAVSTKDDADGPEKSPAEPMVSKEWPLLPEQKLQRAVRASLDKLEPGLVAIDGGREQGRRDITAKDQAGNIVVIELWSGIVAYDSLASAIPGPSLWLLAGGGILYSFGTLFHLWERLRFHNAIWHGFVLLATSCHYSAVLACLLSI